ncbi:hypothetical protein ACJX0J_042426, partial [Zea mays]
ADEKVTDPKAHLEDCSKAKCLSQWYEYQDHCVHSAKTHVLNVLIALDKFSKEDSVQLGFLPREVAKWVAPLSYSGFFNFSGFIYPREALEAAFGVTNTKVQLLLYVSKFIASFASAAGKRPHQDFDSQESYPEWGCWTANHELKKPLISLLFPTIDRVKKGLVEFNCAGICFLYLSVGMWDVTLGQPCVRHIVAHTRCANAVAVAPNDKYLCTRGSDQKVLVLSLTIGLTSVFLQEICMREIHASILRKHLHRLEHPGAVEPDVESEKEVDNKLEDEMHEDEDDKRYSPEPIPQQTDNQFEEEDGSFSPQLMHGNEDEDAIDPEEDKAELV